LLGGTVASSALAVVAHPDDESFGLGGVLTWLSAVGLETRVLCFTHGEASTLGSRSDLAATRERELRCAADQLGVSVVTLLNLADGCLADVRPDVLDAHVDANAGTVDLVVVFDPSGVTGHPDHRAATAAAERIARRRGLAVLEWGVSREVAATLNSEFGTTFTGLEGDDIAVDRSAQWRAIECHDSQFAGNQVVLRRLELQADRDRVRAIPADAAPV
jgi:LmbE family N-acetylglucosaminyl deacetylase